MENVKIDNSAVELSEELQIEEVSECIKASLQADQD